MTKRERVEAVVAGHQPDRPPISFWYHFPSDQHSGRAAVDAHLKHLDRYDLDFLKVMFDLPYPHAGRITSVSDLSDLKVLSGSDGSFAEQLAVIGDLRTELGPDVPMITTVFNAWATMRHLVRDDDYVSDSSRPADQDPLSRILLRFMAEDRGAVASALGIVGESLGNFARSCIEAGADGVYLSVRDDWVDIPENSPGTYDAVVRPADAAILAGASDGTFNMLHVCGRARNLAAFAEYPIHALHWADRASGPSIADAATWLKPAICGGLNHVSTLSEGSAEACAAEVCDAVAQAGDRAIIVAPGCTYAPDRVPHANLVAARRAVDAL
jgi:uroporphyrinogen decarboxylase